MSDPILTSRLLTKQAEVSMAGALKAAALRSAVPHGDTAAEAHIAKLERDSIARADRNGADLLRDVPLSVGRFVNAVAGGALAVPGEMAQDSASGRALREMTPGLNLLPDAVRKGLMQQFYLHGGRASAQADTAMADSMSDISQFNEAIVGEKIAERAQKNAQLQQQAIDTGTNETVAGIQRFGRDTLAGLDETLDNPTYLSNQIVGQAPTLLMGVTANALAKGTVAARAGYTNAAHNAAVRAGMMSPAARNLAGREALEALRNEAAKTYLTAGTMAMEGSSAYGGTSQEILTAPIETLAERFPGVREQLAQNVSEDEIRISLAHELGTTNAAVVAPVAGAAARLTTGFELAPTGTTGTTSLARLGNSAGTIAGEFAEEGVQSGSSELIGNLTERYQGGNESQDLLEGVGVATGQGAATGAVFSGSLQSPALVGSTVGLIKDAAVAAAKPIGNAIKTQVEAAKTAEQADVQATAEQAQQTRRDRINEIDASVQAAAISDTETPAANVLAEPVDNEPLLSPEFKAAGGTRVQAMSTVLDAMREEQAKPEGERDGNRVLNMALFTIKTSGQLRARLAEIEPESAEAQAIQNTLLNPEITELEEALPTMFTPEVLESLTSAIGESPDFATPKSQQAAEQIAVLAEVAPDQVSSEAARSVAMYQRLAPTQVKHLETVAQVAEIREAHTAAYQRIGKADGKTPDIVTQEVTEAGWGEKRPSLAQYQTRIMGAMVKGDLATASKSMRALQNFARHYGNKSKAYDQAMVAGASNPNKGVPVAYRTLNAEGKLTDMPSAWVIPSKPGSQNLVEHIFNDGNTVAEMYNQLATAYSELIKVNKTARTPLEARLNLPGEPTFRAVPPVKVTEAAPVEVKPAPVTVVPAEDAVTTARENARKAVEQEAQELGIEAKMDFETMPVDDVGIAEAASLSDEAYLQRVNPEGKVTSVEFVEDTILEELDVDAPSSKPIATTGDGIELRPNGNYLYAVDTNTEDNLVVGMVANDIEGNTFAVHPEYQGRGIGKALMRELLRRKPLALSGGLSAGAQAIRLSVLQEFRDGQAPQVGRFDTVPKLLEAFAERSGAQSLLARVPLAMRTLSKAIKQAGRGDPSALKQLFLDPKVEINATQITGLNRLVNQIVPEVIRQLNANLETSIGQGKRFDPDTGTWVERTGAKAQGWLEDFVDGKRDVGPAQFSAAVLEYGRDEQGAAYVRYQPEVAQAMALASLSWVIKQVNAPVNFSDEDKAALFPDGMPPRLNHAFNTMHFATQPVRTIANDIVRMLGMQGKKDASVTLTDGIAKAMALDVITALHDGKALVLRQEAGTELTADGKGYKKLTFIDLKGADGVEVMKGVRTDVGTRVLTKLLDPESQDLPTFAPVTTVPMLVSGTEQKLSAKQQDQVRKTNATKAYRNPSLLLFADRMGDRFLQLLGKDSTTDEKSVHPDYWKTIDGVNKGLDYALERVQDLDLMIHEHAGDNADDQAIHWSHYVVSNGRVMQNGFGGQGDKQAREMFSANKVTGDLSTDTAALAKGYYLAAAQALGIKTELIKNAQAVADIRARLATAPYQALFTDLQSLLRGEGELEALADSIQAQMATLLTKPGEPASAKAIHALVTHARLLEARSQGTADAFTTYLGFELDGKTNGPINAIVHFGLMGKKMLKALRKGGLFVDEAQPRTLSDEVAAGQYSDLYKDLAVETEARIGTALATRESGSRESKMLWAGLRVLTLAKHVELDTNKKTLDITRGMAKAAMVPTVYGSGARGVANQMASDVQAGLVKYLSEVSLGNAVLDANLVEAVRDIMSERWDKKSKQFVRVTPPDFSRGPLRVEFNDQHFAALVDNLVGGQRLDADTRVPAGAAGIMRAAIEDQLKPVMDTFQLVFMASRLQMFRFNEAYRAAYDAKRAELIAAGTLNQYHALSRADEEAIRDSLRDLMPAYPLAMTGGAAEGQGVFAGVKDYNGKFEVTDPKTGKTRPYQAQSLVGGMHMDLNVRQYLSPGVKAAPLLTIGGGDATMMHLLAEANAMDNTLNVYDGWEVGIDRIGETALAANNAVLKSWQFDLLGPVAASIVDLDPAAAVKQYGSEALGETLGLRQYRKETGTEFDARVLEAVKALQTEINERADLIATNKKTLFTQHKISVDQMSGGENPATRGYTTAELQGTAVSVDEAPAPIAGESAELVKRLGEDYQNGLRELDQVDLQLLLSTFPFTDKVRAFVAMKIAHLIPNDVRVFVGTPAQITAKQEELFPGEDLGDGRVPGVSYKGVAFLTIASEETLVHELVHLTTLHLTQRHFAGAKGLTAAQRDAVRELEKMIPAFLVLPARNESIRSAQMEVQLRMDEGLPALAINEMLAWSLANTEIAAQLQGTEAPGVLKKVAKTIRTLVRRLLGLPQNQAIESFLDQMGSNFNRLARRPRLADTHSALATFQRLAGPDHGGTHAAHLESMYRTFGTLLHQLRVRTEAMLAPEAARLEKEHLLLKADQELATLQDSGFQLTEREQHLFRMVQAVIGSNLALDPAVMTEFDKLYAHAMESLDETVFLTNGSEVDEQLARRQWSALFNDGRTRTDAQGRSVMLGNFVAMALSHEGLRQALAKLEPPKPEVKGETFDARLRDRVSRAFDWLSDRALGTKVSSQKMQLDRLAWRLGQLQLQAAQQAARNEQGGGVINRLEAKLTAGMEQLDAQAERVANNTSLKGWMRQSVQWTRGMLSEEQAGANAEMTQSVANQPKVPQVIVDLVSELGGNTSSTVRLHRLVNLTRHAVSRVRQQLREEAPADVRAFFETALDEKTWAELHRTVGTVDLQSLGSLGLSKLASVVTDAAVRQQEITALLAQLGPNQALYEQEALVLARAITHKDVGPRYRNAEALAHLFGRASVTARQAKRLTPLLDRLVSLYALEQLTDLERSNLGGLLRRDPTGMQKLLNTMRTLVNQESRKGEQRHRLNRWKGWVPASVDPRQQIVLANTKQAEALVKRGYQKVGTYQGDRLDPANDLAYYAVNWIGGQATFNQGALQTVEGTLSGVDALTGQSLDPGVGTLITNEGVVSSIAARHAGPGNRLLTPIYDPDGEVMGYERVLDPAVVAAHTNGRRDLALSIGIWLGRQAEEELAEAMNGQVVGALAQRWQADKGNRDGEYVAINTSKDPVIADTWNTIPKHTQAQLLAAFGGEKVMIRRDMMRNAVGYRSASIADAFTGLSTLPIPVRRAIIDAVYLLPGLDYKKIVAAEKAIQGAVGTAKDWIVVRSGMVAIANGVANMFQLMASGVSPLQLPKLIARKAQETEIYLRNEKRLSRIRVELTAVKRPDAKNKLLLERQRLLDANSRLSIAPLIFAGELPTIAEGLSEHDEFTLTGDFSKWVDKQSEQLPQGVLTAAKFAAIAKDTALYQGLNRMVQFGDFTAKAVLYDKWIAEGMSPEVALEKISERFVNYNLNAGRSREYLESMGLLWFWNYKLRVQKVVLATIRENPLRFLLSSVGAGLAGSDSLLTSAAPFVYWDYSIGPDQLFRAPEATLWHQLFG